MARPCGGKGGAYMSMPLVVLKFIIMSLKRKSKT